MDDKSDKEQICIQSTKDEEEEEEWSVSCSDDEKYNVNPANKSKILWEPKPEEIVQLYRSLKEKGILDLEWKCIGRRSPTPPASNENCVEDCEDESRDDEQKKTSESNEFDFDDESTSATTIKPRRLIGNAKLRGSGQKRTASLKNVVSEIFRHRKLENMSQKPNNS